MKVEGEWKDRSRKRKDRSRRVGGRYSSIPGDRNSVVFREIETRRWKRSLDVGQFLHMWFRNSLAGCADTGLFWEKLAIYRSLLEETRWLGS